MSAPGAQGLGEAQVNIGCVCPKVLEEACRYPPQAPNAWGSASQYSDLRPRACELACDVRLRCPALGNIGCVPESS